MLHSARQGQVDSHFNEQDCPGKKSWPTDKLLVNPTLKFQMKTKSKKMHRSLSALKLARNCVLGSVFAGVLHSASWAVNIAESFTGTSAPAWVLSGNAALTAPGTDPDGSGWLRLTAASPDQSGSAIYNTAFSSADGVQVTFTYATYGGTGADGFSFYLIDGATATPTLGAVGGALGYSMIISSARPGVTNGYLGIGFDEWGNFVASDVGTCVNIACAGTTTPNSVGIRGSGSLLTGFDLLARQVFSTVGTGSRAGAKIVRITVSPAPNVTATVEIDSGSGFVTVIPATNVSSAVGQAPIPATFKMGFGAATGGATNIHEIRGFTTVNAPVAATVAAASIPTLSEWGMIILAALLALGSFAILRRRPL
jgi:hypothetical protein